MTRLLEILISMAIVAVLFVLVGVFLPSSRTITEKVETNRRQSIVFDTLNSVHRVHEWNALALRDPAIEIRFRSGRAGRAPEYKSKERPWARAAGKSSRASPIRVVYASRPPTAANKRMAFSLRRSRGGRNIEITQTYSVDYG